jgi:beta-phosphoglucomutase-like phosphatase (HAD superfamily)
LVIDAKYSGIIFDFNGVLWWDRSIQEQAWQKFAEGRFGISLSDEAMRIEVHGRNNQHTLQFLAGRDLAEDEVRQLGQQKERLYRDLCLTLGEKFILSPGAEDLLAELAVHGIPRTIATASGKENLDFFREHLELDKWFDHSIIVYDDGSRPGKPAPEIYLLAANRLRLKPADCIVVEDSLSGIKSAHSAGIGHIVVISSDERIEKNSKLDGVDQVIGHLGDLDWKELLL